MCVCPVSRAQELSRRKQLKNNREMPSDQNQVAAALSGSLEQSMFARRDRVFLGRAKMCGSPLHFYWTNSQVREESELARA